MKRPLYTLGLLAAFVTASTSARAQDAADWLRLSSAATNEINAADPNPDEAFFSVKGAPPTIIFIVDTSGSMQELVVQSFTIDRGSGSGEGSCEAEDYNGPLDAGGFSMSKHYPAPEDFPSLFSQNRFYFKTGSGLTAVNGLNTTTYDKVDNLSSNTETSVEDACDRFRSNQREKCKACLNSRGYFLGHRSGNTKQDVFSGKFLNFYPPKFVTAREVLKKVIRETDRVRIGLARFNTSASGGRLLQSPTPQCTAAQNPESAEWEQGRQALVDQVNDLTFSGGTPLAEALFDVGTYFVEDLSRLQNWFGSGWSRRSTFTPHSNNTEKRSICYGCQVSAAILISDGVPSGAGNVPQAVRDMGISCSGSGCSNQYLDDVAAFFYQHDLQGDLPPGAGLDGSGMQRMSTYTIGFGIQLPIMGSAASVGGGTYQEANDGTSLSTAITSIINDINRRATTAGSTSVASLQATGETTTLVPRFRPGADDAPWKGFLYRFGLVNELTNNCVASGDPSNPGANDVDKDGFCNSIAYVDADNDIVVEDEVTGEFIKAGNGNPAVPHWEAGGRMVQSSGTYDPDGDPDETAASRRNLWTAVPDGEGGWDMVEFHPSKAEDLMHLMGLTNDVRADQTCRDIATRLGEMEDLEEELKNWGADCARIIISYYRGEQALHKDPDERALPREWLLADIFHSSPIVVEPPIRPESCANFPSQCVASLWVEAGDFSKPEAREAYVDFVQGDHCGVDGSEPCERRRAIALVGSNGGFLHAFDMGVPEKEEFTDNRSNRDLLTGRLPMETPGTGVELWGFMPPDLLGNLKQGMRQHTYMVDGTAMVREVWVDGSGASEADGKKDADEFRTVAVVGTGSGGSHYFALDLTQSVKLPPVESLRTAGTKPELLWLWPEPGSPRVADMGQTFSNFFPRPPPIGPVLLEDTTGQGFSFEFDDPNEDGNGFTRRSVDAEERWIVGLNGGVDPNLQRGRGFALVDVWTGETVWERFWDPSASDARKDLHHPIPAGLALMDIGSGQLSAEAPFDGYFDTLTVGDMGGNLWVARMHRPGAKEPGQPVHDYWHLARAFQTEKGDEGKMTRRRPITYLTSNALQRTTGYMRTFFGTGDRGSLLDSTTGQCSLGNLQACISMGCNVRVDEWRDQLPNTEYRSTHWSNGQLQASTIATGPCVNADCIQKRVQACVSGCTETSCTGASGDGDASGRASCIERARTSASCRADACDGSASLNMGMMSLVSVTGCDPTPDHTPMVRAIDSSCGLRNVTVSLPKPTEENPDATEQITYVSQVCGSVTLKNDAAYVVSYDVESDAADVRHRFVGVHSYGGAGERFFSTASTAASFDAARLSEVNLTSLGSRSVPAAGEADPLSSGWYLNYDQVNERTASPAGMAASLTGDSLCVVWNSLVPGEEGAVCGGPGQQEAHMIQADFATGSATCLQDFQPGERSVARTVIAAPPEPTPATVVGAGSITSGFVTTEPGESPRFIRGFTNADPLQPIYQLELSHQEHQCRHTAVATACGI